MPRPAKRVAANEPPSLFQFVRHVIHDDLPQITKWLATTPELATMTLTKGATRTVSTQFLFPEIAHHMYGGDTALHMAAVASRLQVAKLLVAHGADFRARNRRGAEPLHYAADADWADLSDPLKPSSYGRNQPELIAYLVSLGADPNARDKSGVAPLHRAVRHRIFIAVKALLDAGADVRQRNSAGSTPLHLAVQTTGASGSGSPVARIRQEAILRLLLERGAKWSDKDDQGNTPDQTARNAWVRNLVAELKST